MSNYTSSMDEGYVSLTANMKNYLAQNAKMKKSSGIRTFNFGIPAFKSASGFRTCPMAGTCATGCYAQAGTFTWPVVKSAYETRLALTRTPEFVSVIDHEIKRRKIKRVRIHDSGDFYSPAYLNKWLAIMRLNPDTKFYAYTKMVKLLKNATIPANFTVVMSFGGKQDSMINRSVDRHSSVFPSLAVLKQAGYADSSKDDSVAAQSKNHRIGLIYHGSKAKTWTTNEAAV